MYAAVERCWLIVESLLVVPILLFNSRQGPWNLAQRRQANNSSEGRAGPL